METVGTQIPQALSQNRHSRLLLSEVAPNASLAVERVENARGPTARALTLARLPITLAMPSRHIVVTLGTKPGTETEKSGQRCTKSTWFASLGSLV